MSNDKTLTMDELLQSNSSTDLKIGDSIEGTIISVKKHEVWFDLGIYGLGVVLRREISFGQQLEVGQKMPVSVVDTDMEDGNILLSLRKAAKDRGWDELQTVFEEKTIIEVKAYDANRGGLLIECEGIRGFLPVSQLSSEHYPRVSGADKDEILQKLSSIIGQVIRVRILDISRKDNKLIFSEKEAIKDDMQAKFSELQVGQEITGLVTGVTDFGAFINMNGIEGLVHKSEISWERIDDPRKYVAIGDTVKAKIISIEKEKLSLSIKQTTPDPWLGEVEHIKKGDDIEGTITRITPFGAFVQISPSVEALVHVSEISDDDKSGDPEKVFKLHEKKSFKVIDIDKENRKIALSLKDKK